MMNRFVLIREELISANSEEKGEQPTDSGKKFMKKREKYAIVLSEVNIGCKSLQMSGDTLVACQDDSDALLNTACDIKDDRNSVFYQYKMYRKYISERPTIFLCPNFESRVVKIQSGMSKALKPAEKTAVRNWTRATPSDSIFPIEHSGLEISSQSNSVDIPALLARHQKAWGKHRTLHWLWLYIRVLGSHWESFE